MNSTLAACRSARAMPAFIDISGGASPLGLPYTVARKALRRLAPLRWLASLRSLAR